MRLLLALLALTVASCTDEALPTGALSEVEGRALAADATRAMKIRAGVLVDVVNEVMPTPAPCQQLFSSVINGTATHLGRFEGVGSTCVLDVVAPDPDPPFLPPGPAPYLTTGELDSGAVNEDGQGPDDFESSGWIRF
jgi:hypothetical protein